MRGCVSVCALTVCEGLRVCTCVGLYVRVCVCVLSHHVAEHLLGGQALYGQQHLEELEAHGSTVSPELGQQGIHTRHQLLQIQRLGGGGGGGGG